MSLTSTLSSTLCIVFPTKPNSITGEILEINLASEVPPEVDFSGVVLIIFFIALSRVDFKSVSYTHLRAHET